MSRLQSDFYALSLTKQSSLVQGPGSINCNQSQFQLQLNDRLILDNSWEVCLSQISLMFSWQNVTAAYGNNTISYIFNSQTYTVTLADGFYKASDINNVLQAYQKSQGHYLVVTSSDNVISYEYLIVLQPNYVFSSTTITINPTPATLPAGTTNPNNLPLGVGAQIVLGSIGELLGYLPGTYPSAMQATKYQTNGSIFPQNPVQTVSVCTNLVQSSLYNSNSSSIHTMIIQNASWGDIISSEPTQKVWLPVLNCEIPSIRCELRDQSGRPINILNRNLLITIFLRKVR